MSSEEGRNSLTSRSVFDTDSDWVSESVSRMLKALRLRRKTSETPPPPPQYVLANPLKYAIIHTCDAEGLIRLCGG